MSDRPAAPTVFAASADDVRAGYALGRVLSARHGRSYHLAARLLPPPRRAAVHALYGFARTVDDIVDVEAPHDPARATRRLRAVETTLAGREDPALGADERRILAAACDTVARFDIDPAYITAFLRSMSADVPGSPEARTVYDTMLRLREYMYGSAAVIGLQMLPILGVSDRAAAEPGAAALGEAFQLTNFVRDVGEDLDRGRVYLPTDHWAAFGVDVDLLRAVRASGRRERRVARAIAHFVAIARASYRGAEPALALLDARVRPAIATAFHLYARILDEVDRAEYHILDRRVVVGRTRRAGAIVAGVRTALVERESRVRTPSPARDA